MGEAVSEEERAKRNSGGRECMRLKEFHNYNSVIVKYAVFGHFNRLLVVGEINGFNVSGFTAATTEAVVVANVSAASRAKPVKRQWSRHLPKTVSQRSSLSRD